MVDLLNYDNLEPSEKPRRSAIRKSKIYQLLNEAREIYEEISSSSESIPFYETIRGIQRGMISRDVTSFTKSVDLARMVDYSLTPKAIGLI